MGIDGPTYNVVYPGRLDGETEIEIAWTVIGEVLPSADRAALQLDLDVLPDEYQDFATTVRNGDRSADDGLYRFDPEDEEILRRIVTHDSPYRNIVLERLELSREGERLLHYVPDHTILEISATAPNLSLEEANDTLRRHGAAVVTTESIPGWEENGARASIEPPALCVEHDGVSGRTCFSLSDIDAVSIEHDGRTITLSWRGKSGSLPKRVIGAVFERLGADRPEQITFESEEELQAAVSLFERLPDVAVHQQSPG